MVVAIPLRHPIAAGAEHAVEGVAGDGQLFARVGGNDLLDQRVHDRILDAGQIVRALGVGSLRREERPHAVARRRRQRETLHGHVEIEILQPGAILHGIDQTERRLDAEHGEILDVRPVMRLDRRLVDQKLDLEDVAVRQPALAVLDRKPGLLQQLRGLAQQRAVLPRPVRDRRHEGLAEHLVRHLAAERLEQLHLLGRWRPLRHHVRVLERRVGARIGAVHDGLVGPFEIEGVDQGLAHARILELRRGAGS